MLQYKVRISVTVPSDNKCHSYPFWWGLTSLRKSKCHSYPFWWGLTSLRKSKLMAFLTLGRFMPMVVMPETIGEAIISRSSLNSLCNLVIVEMNILLVFLMLHWRHVYILLADWPLWYSPWWAPVRCCVTSVWESAACVEDLLLQAWHKNPGCLIINCFCVTTPSLTGLCCQTY